MKTFTLHSRDYFNTAARKRYYNELLFTEVAPKYDLITRLLSFGRDREWKEAMIQSLPDIHPKRCLDLACGTGDLTRMVHYRYPDAEVTGVDLTPAMIERARLLTESSGITYEVGDMGSLRFLDGTMDLVTGGYALRNAPDIDVALNEINRVLTPHGLLAFLDFSKPVHPMGQRWNFALLKSWGSLWGYMLHRHADVYGYIAESLARYPDRQALRGMLKKRGLCVVMSKRYFGGLLEWVVARKIS
ncbi:MAG TPA: ubiquinone/menaquinone biosynthesis methyltransferase [Kiritimatiellia bacterium]|mgnify:CR=1 FL=1|nr:ubiquinone/menaquinone biosynthesis methyltransferase [Kiritimatiellia bacterium]HMP00654.1 ubiquinone/menaquinone biosynthesis methyltransferase [Kiritimatiellia bacterium]HMP91110.1 ubiquinone/menaquinone biosynthesis methyltransferase [Kiritimatiellia bacterium]